LILIFRALVALDGVADDGVAECLCAAAGAGVTLVLTETLGTDGVEGGAMADPPEGNGFLSLSPPEGNGFLMGLATMLLPCFSGEGSFFTPEGSATLWDGDELVLLRMSASRLGLEVFSVTMRRLGAKPSGVADLGVDLPVSVFGRFATGVGISSLSWRGRFAEDGWDGVSKMMAEFDRLIMLGLRGTTGVELAVVELSKDADEIDLGTPGTGVLILIDGARVSSGGGGRLASTDSWGETST
jgi:hypothetical protein